MLRSKTSVHALPLQLCILTVGLVATGCGATGTGTGLSVGGNNGVGGSTESGGSTNAANGGTSAAAQVGGAPANGGNSPNSTGGMPGADAPGTGTGGGTSTVNCAATIPTGGTQHTGNTQGGSNNLAWNLWSNPVVGSMTTFSTPAFSATWTNAGDFLARLGLEWGTNSKAYTAYGTITAQFAYTKTGTGGDYSYIGIYGWSTNPCIEYYIVDDSYNTMPVNPGTTTLKGTATIDGGTYNLYTRPTTGTGGNRCGATVTSWNQFYSVRKTARQCGTISITQHFDAWAAAGMALGNMLEAKILVEVGGGTGTINFQLQT